MKNGETIFDFHRFSKVLPKKRIPHNYIMSIWGRSVSSTKNAFLAKSNIVSNIIPQAVFKAKKDYSSYFDSPRKR